MNEGKDGASRREEEEVEERRRRFVQDAPYVARTVKQTSSAAQHHNHHYYHHHHTTTAPSQNLRCPSIESTVRRTRRMSRRITAAIMMESSVQQPTSTIIRLNFRFTTNLTKQRFPTPLSNVLVWAWIHDSEVFVRKRTLRLQTAHRNGRPVACRRRQATNPSSKQSPIFSPLGTKSS